MTAFLLLAFLFLLVLLIGEEGGVSLNGEVDDVTVRIDFTSQLVQTHSTKCHRLRTRQLRRTQIRRRLTERNKLKCKLVVKEMKNRMQKNVKITMKWGIIQTITS